MGMRPRGYEAEKEAERPGRGEEFIAFRGLSLSTWDVVQLSA